MDLDSLDAPMFVDFDMIKRGEEEGEGDEWFDKKIDDDDDTFTNTSTSLTDKEPKLTQLASPAQPVAREQPHVAREEPTEPNKESLSDDAVKSALAIMASKPPPTRKRKSSERNAALKATASIHSMLKPQTNKSKLLTKDQYDQQKIDQIRKEAERQRELSKKSFKMFKKRCAAGSHSSSMLAPLKPKAPTQPVEFHFKTDERFKNTPTSHASSSNESPFPNNLRVTDKPEYIPNDPSERKPSTPKAPTKPKPFKFQTETRVRSRGITPPTEKFVSRAEFAEKYEKGTPPRFRTKRPRRSLSSERDYYSTRITVAVSPKLTARHRSRSPHVMSNAEKEERMMEEFKKNQFRARPIPPGLFKGGDQCTGIPQVSALNKIPLTTPVSPNITKPIVNKRDTSDNENEIQPEKKFKALPIPRDMFSSVKGVPVKRPMDVTVPQSPNITKKRKTVDEEEEPPSPPPPAVSTIKPLPMPKFNKPFQPTLAHTQSTVPQPFSFDNKYTSKDEVIEQLVKKEEEELAKKREFTARKMPEPAPPPTIVKTHQKTLPEPFALKIDEIGLKKVAKFQEKLAELEKEREEMSKFKASDPSSLYTRPFIPAKSTKPLTETSNTHILQTELRSELRSQFELEKKSREEERERTEEERKAVREAEEAEEIKALRRSLVHKAQPIHHYTPLSIVPSTKKLTTPTSPVLVSKQRKENESHDL